MLSPSPAPTVSVSGVRLSYNGEPLFSDFSLTLPGGQTTCLLGPSGIGKSRLLAIIAGLEKAAQASVAADDGASLEGRVAWMAQQDLLLPWLTVLENVVLGDRLRGARPSFDRAVDLLARVELADRKKDRPSALSGGMRQRVALARTLYEDKPVVLMDEPFSALDAITRLQVQDLASRLLRNKTVLLVTHDPLEAARLGHFLHVMLGRPARLGTPLRPAGEPPRAAEMKELMLLQARLLKELRAAQPSAEGSAP